MESQDEILSRREIAATLGVSLVTFDRYVREGTAPPTFIYKRRRIGRRAAVLKWLSERGLSPLDVQSAALGQR